MKPILNLENDILHITMKINTQFPELAKYLDEMPLRISETDNDIIQNKNLAEYHNSLLVLFNKYAKTHLPKNTKSPIMENLDSKSLNQNYFSRNKPMNEEDEDEEEEETMNEKDFEEDMSGDDLDVPGAELDDLQESIGSEDEENNYYSLGGDNHNDLEEDNG